MKILHVIRGLANSSGTTHIVIPLSEAQARLGAAVTVFYVDKPPFPALEPDPRLVTSRCFPRSLPLDNPGISWPFARAMRGHVKEFDVVHIHAVWNFPTYYAMRAAWKASVPYMVAPQGSFEPWALGQNSWGKKLYGWATEIPLLKRATCLQALTAKEATQFQRYGIQAPTAIIPNGIDEHCFQRRTSRLTERLGLPQDRKTLLFLSRLHPKKGLDVLVEAFARLVITHPKVTLIIAGHDAGTGYKGIIRQKMAAQGIEPNCLFLGEVKGEEKYDILLGADAFVLPSYSEGLPVAVVEALGAGLPVVITHDCNIPEVAEWQAGYVVRPDPGEVAEALGKLFDDPACARRMGENGQRLVKEKFTWRGIAEQTLRVYEEACAR